MSRKTTSRAKSPSCARVRWNEDAARDLIDAVHASGETIAEYARKRGLNPWVLYDWRRRLGASAKPAPTSGKPAAGPSASTGGAFLPVRITQPQTSMPPSAELLEVVLAGGRRVRVPANFDDAALRRLVSILEEVC